MYLHYTCIVFLAVASSAFADRNDDVNQMIPIFEGNFRDMDNNTDGKVTLQELSATFLRDDRNGDGNVTLQEYTQDETLDENKNVLAEEFTFYDVNSDGVISIHDLQQMFQTIDTNGDGSILQAEFVQYATHLFVNHLHPSFAVGK